MTKISDIEEIIQALIKFRDERDWAQFHNNKDLALALMIEAAELNELFLWKNGQQVEQIDKQRLSEELADVLSYAFLLAYQNNLDIREIILNKMKINEQKYPVDKAKGKADKYTEL